MVTPRDDYGGQILGTSDVSVTPPLAVSERRDGFGNTVLSVSADEVKLELINPLRPGLLSAAGDSFWYLIMPIRLAG